MKFRSVILVISYTIACNLALAQDETDVMNVSTGVLRAAHQSVSNAVFYTTDKLDSFIGGADRQNKQSKSQIYLRLTTDNSSSNRPRVYHSIGARIHLPRTEENFKLLISSGFREENENMNNTSARPQTHLQDDESETDVFSTALQYMVQLNQSWNLDYRLGVDTDNIHLYPFARLYSRHTFAQTQWRERFVQQVFIHDEAGIGQETRLDIERNMFSSSLFSLTSKINWSEEENQVDLSQTVNLSYRLLQDVYLQHTLGANGIYEQGANLQGYVASTVLRYKLYRKWSYLDISPLVNFYRSENFKPRLGVIVAYQLSFGK